MRTYELLQLLSKGQFFSGEELGRQLSISRTAVWNHIKQIRELGLDVHAVQGKGYRLADPIELLEHEQILSHLDDALKEEFLLEVFPQLDSTNRYLMQRIYELPASKSRICLSDYQTAGRGRRGRQWISPFGSNIYFSQLWRFGKGIGAIEGLSLVVALALCEMLQELGIEGVGIKWPNDIYFNQRKLAGILLEMSGEASGSCNVVIGIGINVNMSRLTQLDIDQPWIDLAEIFRGPVSRNLVAARLIETMQKYLSEFDDAGFTAFQSRWRQFDLLHDQNVEIREIQGTRQGVARGIDDSGALLIENAKGLERVLSGDVSIRFSEKVD